MGKYIQNPRQITKPRVKHKHFPSERLSKSQIKRRKKLVRVNSKFSTDLPGEENNGTQVSCESSEEHGNTSKPNLSSSINKVQKLIICLVNSRVPNAF